MTDPAIREAAARALRESVIALWKKNSMPWEDGPWATHEVYLELAERVTPLIEAAALERAAKVAEECMREPEIQWLREHVAAAIRALKDQP